MSEEEKRQYTTDRVQGMPSVPPSIATKHKAEDDNDESAMLPSEDEKDGDDVVPEEETAEVLGEENSNIAV